MTDPPTRVDAAMAGLSPIAAMLAGSAAGYGLGSPAAPAVSLGLPGLFAVLVGSLALVYARFRRL